MGNPLSFHYVPNHRHQFYLDAISKVKPNIILLLDASRDDYLEVKRRSPLTKIIMRSYDWSDGGMSVLERARNNPVDTGTWMARQWIQRVKEWGGAIDVKNTYFTGVNEYTVIPNVPIPPLVVCEGQFAKVMWQEGGLHSCIGNEGVGHPSMTNSAGKVDWSLYAPWERIIQDTGSILGLHEYWLAENGPRMNVKPMDEARGLFWYAWRFMQCPLDVPIAITEWGVDQKIDAPYGTPSHGWQGILTPHEFSMQLMQYVQKAVTDERFVGATIFTHDYKSEEWATYDTSRGLNEICDAASGLPHIGWYKPGVVAPPVQPPVTPPTTPTTSTLVHPLPAGTFRLTQRFNETTTNPKGHEGTDFGANLGTNVIAIADGEIAWVGVDKDYGNYIRLYCKQLNVHFFFAHLSTLEVAKGTIVKRGHVLGKVGSTGNSTGNHLHLEARLANPDGSYSKITPKLSGRCDPETFCAIYGIDL